MIIDNFRQHQHATGCDVEVVGPDDQGYDQDRVIANSRFDYYPALIAYCENAEHVACCINFCRTFDVPFRVRSGGHQHEGMCSANDVVLIDLSRMTTIEFVGGDDTLAWIPAGKKLHDVYDQLEVRARIIPGGSCDSVNVGGLRRAGVGGCTFASSA
jgi:FAD/FMN-containing dehydrogenase